MCNLPENKANAVDMYIIRHSQMAEGSKSARRRVQESAEGVWMINDSPAKQIALRGLRARYGRAGG